MAIMIKGSMTLSSNNENSINERMHREEMKGLNLKIDNGSAFVLSELCAMISLFCMSNARTQ